MDYVLSVVATSAAVAYTCMICLKGECMSNTVSNLKTVSKATLQVSILCDYSVCIGANPIFTAFFCCLV